MKIEIPLNFLVEKFTSQCTLRFRANSALHSLWWRKNESNKHVYFTSFILMYYFWNRISTSDQFRLELLTTMWPSSRFLQPKGILSNNFISREQQREKKYFYEIFKPIHSSFSPLPIGNFSNFSKRKILYITLIIPFFFFFFSL